jgi:transcriptional regulator with XRE-family HTH domain
MIDFQSMERNIVRTVRTCQGFAESETTFRGYRGEISTMGSDEEIGRRLIAVREHFTRNQTEFADDLRIAKNTLNGYEKGSRRLTLETASRIRDRYGISTDWLLFGDVGQPSHDLAVKLGPKPKIEADTKKPKPTKKRRKAS